MSESLKKSKQKDQMLPLKIILGMSIQLGFSVATATILSVYGGHWLDKKYGTEHFFWIGIALGLIVSLYMVWKIVKPLQSIAKGETNPNNF